MDASTLILMAPCSLLLGAALQILVARLCSARAKGILAFLTCLPALFAVAGIAPWVRGGQGIDLHPLPWDGPLALVLHVDALSVLFAFMGACIGGFVLLYSIGYMAHDKSATRFYAPCWFSSAASSGWCTAPISSLLSLLGTGGPVLVQPGRLLVHQPRGGERRAQSAADDAHRGLRTAGGDSASSITARAAHCGPIRPWRTAFTGGVFVLMLVALVAKSRAGSRCTPGFPRPWPRRLR